jgi:hypothetical protein
MQLDEHVRASTERWKSKPVFHADTDQGPETWERRLKGNGQVTPILQAAHVATYLLDPVYASCVYRLECCHGVSRSKRACTAAIQTGSSKGLLAALWRLQIP